MTISVFGDMSGVPYDIHANCLTFHNLIECKADHKGAKSWLRFANGHSRPVIIYMPLHVAEAMADAWSEVEGLEPIGSMDEMNRRILGDES